MALKPLYKVVILRENLSEGKPLDASEFDVHLDHMRDGRAPQDHRAPAAELDEFLCKGTLEVCGKKGPLSNIKVEMSSHEHATVLEKLRRYGWLWQRIDADFQTFPVFFLEGDDSVNFWNESKENRSNSGKKIYPTQALPSYSSVYAQRCLPVNR